MNEEITIPFYNDLLFKYFISDNDDPESMYVLKKIIETITRIRVHELYDELRVDSNTIQRENLF